MIQSTWMDSVQVINQNPFGNSVGTVNASESVANLESAYSRLDYDPLEQYRSFKGWPYVAIDRIATRVGAMMPIVARRVDAREQIQRQHQWAMIPQVERQIHQAAESKTREWWRVQQSHVRKHYGEHVMTLSPDDFVEPVRDHLMIDLLSDPNGEDDLEAVVYEHVMFERLTGAAFTWVIRDSVRLPEAFWIVPNHMVRRPYDRRKDGWVITIDGRQIPVDEDDMIVSRKKSPFGKGKALSPQSAGGRWVKEGQAIDESKFWSYTNGGMPDAVLEYTGEDNKAFEILKRFNAEFGAQLGLRRHGGTVPIPPRFKPHVLSHKPREMDYPNTSSANRMSIGALHGANDFVLGLAKELTYNTVWASYQQFYDLTVNPQASRVARTFTRLAEMFDSQARQKGVFVFYCDETPTDPELQHRIDVDDMTNGVIDIDERRIARGLDPKGTPAYATGYIGAGRVPMTDFDEPRGQEPDEGRPADDETDDDEPDDLNGGDSGNDDGSDGDKSDEGDSSDAD